MKPWQTAMRVQTGKAQEVRNRINSGKKHYYTMIKELTVFGYFTSEPGATRALRYTQTPGYYQGEVAYKKGDKAWATLRMDKENKK